jgi:hypothetical protein
MRLLYLIHAEPERTSHFSSFGKQSSNPEQAKVQVVHTLMSAALNRKFEINVSTSHIAIAELLTRDFHNRVSPEVELDVRVIHSDITSRSAVGLFA